MNQNQLPVGDVKSNAGADTSFVDLLIVLAEHKKLLLCLPLIAAALAAAVSFMLPPVFQASTTLLPPQQNQSGAAAILSQLGGVASVVSGGAAAKNPSDLYVAMLRSRTVADHLIAQFGLSKAYGGGSPDQTRAAFAADTRITLSKEGLVVIEYEGKDKKTVAPIANGYVDELLKLTRVLALTEASQRRKFFEYQLEQTKNKLASAEVAFKQGLDTRGVISVDADSRAIMEVVGRLRAQITAKEIQISSMSSFVTENNQDYKRAREELSSLRSELGRLENGRPAPAGGPAEQQAGLENIKLLRDVKYHQMLYELLGKQYEVARLDEAKEGASVQVLDAALEPERKFKPKRALMVLSGALAGLFLAVLWACLAQLKRSALLSPESAARYALLRARLLGR
jgi:tyrosine-protein kinase Etk/Wzc